MPSVCHVPADGPLPPVDLTLTPSVLVTLDATRGPPALRHGRAAGPGVVVVPQTPLLHAPRPGVVSPSIPTSHSGPH